MLFFHLYSRTFSIDLTLDRTLNIVMRIYTKLYLTSIHQMVSTRWCNGVAILWTMLLITTYNLRPLTPISTRPLIITFSDLSSLCMCVILMHFPKTFMWLFQVGITKRQTGLENRMENGMVNGMEKWNGKWNQTWKSCIKPILI